ncbi:MAG: hypothetical protein FVQ82_08620 [Planctomycetes bacterium]|nr:hypothetical protein [Planctomycetota bacterium]
MNKNEALQLFKSSINMIDLAGNFPDCDMVVSELEDGQQEIVIRLQGKDPDFNPSAEIAVIESMGLEDLTDGVKNNIVLRKRKRKMIRERKRRRDFALLKRVKSLVSPAGVSLREIAETIQLNLPVEEVEL